MSMLGRFTRGIARRFGYVPAAKLKSAMYEAARTNRLNEYHWRDAVKAHMNEFLEMSLEKVRERAKYEYAHNCYAKGMTDTYADDVVGRGGPILEITSDSPEFNDVVKFGWSEWAKRPDLSSTDHFNDVLLMNVKHLFHCGEFLVLYTADSESKDPIKFRLLPINPEQLATPLNRAADQRIYNGVKVDRYGKPVTYYVARVTPGRLESLQAVADPQEIDAVNILHVFHRLEVGQTRGVPWLQPALPIFASLRDLTSDTLQAARVATYYGVYYETDLPPDLDTDEGDEDTVLPNIPLESGSGMALPPNWKAKGLSPEQPSTKYGEFKKELLSECGRCVAMPLLRIGLDAQNHSFSGARLDLNAYWSGIETNRNWIARRFLNPVLGQWFRRFVLTSALKGIKIPQRWSPSWIWSPVPSVDPVKERQSEAIDLENGTTSRTEIIMSRGKDPDVIYRQRAEDEQREADLAQPTRAAHVIVSNETNAA